MQSKNCWMLYQIRHNSMPWASCLDALLKLRNRLWERLVLRPFMQLILAFIVNELCKSMLNNCQLKRLKFSANRSQGQRVRLEENHQKKKVSSVPLTSHVSSTHRLPINTLCSSVFSQDIFAVLLRCRCPRQIFEDILLEILFCGNCLWVEVVLLKWSSDGLRLNFPPIGRDSENDLQRQTHQRRHFK